MYVIAGLGNPGLRYRKTRHNVGFDLIDLIAKEWNIDVKEKACKALMGKGVMKGEKVILMKPQTFMNNSGESLRAAVDFYKVDVRDQVIVIYDDIDLAPGQLRIRQKGSAGGHNGIRSIISHLGTQEFARVRIGVGEKPAGYDLADYVLSRFLKDERELVDLALERAGKAVDEILANGIESSMTLYNRKYDAGIR